MVAFIQYIGEAKYPSVLIGLDASLEETHTFKSKVTQFPVETGASISDYIFNEPITLSIQGFVSNHPLDGGEQPGRSALVFNDLLSIRNSRAPITIITGLKQYDNMALTSLSVPKNSKIGEALQFTADFVEINRVNSLTVPAAQLKKYAGSDNEKGVAKKAASTADQGKQVVAPIPQIDTQHYNGWGRALLIWGTNKSQGTDYNVAFDTTLMSER